MEAMNYKSAKGSRGIMPQDTIKDKEKRDSSYSYFEEDGTRSNSSRSKRTKTLSSEVGNYLKKCWQGGSKP